MRAAFLGPEGTFSHEALLAHPGAQDFELVPQSTIHDVIMAVQGGLVERGIAPIENAIEGSVNATLDPLAGEADGVTIVGEMVQQIAYALIARETIEIDEIEAVLSHPQGNAQCARFLRDVLPRARTLPANSTAEAVRMVMAKDEGSWAALGTRAAAQLYGATILRDEISDERNATRFVWLAPTGTPADVHEPEGEWKTSVVFWGPGSDAPGWLARCLGELASRAVNLSRIESRPRGGELGSYMFFLDLVGRDDDPGVAQGIEALRNQTEVLRVLGCYQAG